MQTLNWQEIELWIWIRRLSAVLAHRCCWRSLNCFDGYRLSTRSFSSCGAFGFSLELFSFRRFLLFGYVQLSKCLFQLMRKQIEIHQPPSFGAQIVAPVHAGSGTCRTPLMGGRQTMQASRRRTPNTKFVTPARWGIRGAAHGMENRFHWLALATGPDGKSQVATACPVSEQ